MTSALATADLSRQVARLLRAYLDRPTTVLLKEIAPLIVELRSRHQLADGTTDWGGRSSNYRDLIHSIYREAGVPNRKIATIQGSLRYHVGNELRDRAPHDELAAAGLMTTSPKGRVRAAREAISAMKDSSIPRRDIVRIGSYARALLDYADDTVIPVMTEARAEEARVALEAVQTRAVELLRLIELTRGGDPDTSRDQY